MLRLVIQILLQLDNGLVKSQLLGFEQRLFNFDWVFVVLQSQSGSSLPADVHYGVLIKLDSRGAGETFSSHTPTNRLSFDLSLRNFNICALLA